MDTQLMARPNANAGLALRNFNDMMEFCEVVHTTGMLSKTFKTKEEIFIVLQMGLERGLAPMRALNSYYVVNGQARLHTDAPLALVKESGLLEYIEEHFEGEKESFVAVCTVKRRDEPDPVTRKWTYEDAVRAGQLSKNEIWKRYPKRMMQLKARAWAIRDVFPDVLGGQTIAEEYIGAPIPAATSDNVNAIAEGRKQIESETKQEPRWICENGHKFAVPLPPDGQCPVCLIHEIEEIKEQSDVREPDAADDPED